jgi:hypothetical protein
VLRIRREADDDEVRRSDGFDALLGVTYEGEARVIPVGGCCLAVAGKAAQGDSGAEDA